MMQGLRPIHYAVWQRYAEAVNLLLVRGCDVSRLFLILRAFSQFWGLGLSKWIKYYKLLTIKVSITSTIQLVHGYILYWRWIRRTTADIHLCIWQRSMATSKWWRWDMASLMNWLSSIIHGSVRSWTRHDSLTFGRLSRLIPRSIMIISITRKG